MTANVEHSQLSDIWMIRTTENILSGPFSRQQILQLLEDGQLDLTDEICGSGNYWIFLHEEGEVKANLGVELPKSFFATEESTQTESDKTPAAHLARSIQNSSNSQNSSSSVSGPIAAMGTRGARSTTLAPTSGPSVPVPAADDENVPELSVPADSIEQQASVLSNRAIREFRPRENATRVFNIDAAKAAELETANQQEPQFSGSQTSNSDSYAFHDQEGTPPPIEMPQLPQTQAEKLHHNTSLSLDPETSDWTARFWGIIAVVLIAAAAVVWFFAFRQPS